MQYKCPKCGNTIEEGTNPCPTCGQQFKWPEKVEPIATAEDNEDFIEFEKKAEKSASLNRNCHNALLKNDFLNAYMYALEAYDTLECAENNMYKCITEKIIVGLDFLYRNVDNITENYQNVPDFEDVPNEEMIKFIMEHESKPELKEKIEMLNGALIIAKFMREIVYINESFLKSENLYFEIRNNTIDITSMIVDGIYKLAEYSFNIYNRTLCNGDGALRFSKTMLAITDTLYEVGEGLYSNEYTHEIAIKSLHYYSDNFESQTYNKECGDLIRITEPDYVTKYEYNKAHPKISKETGKQLVGVAKELTDAKIKEKYGVDVKSLKGKFNGLSKKTKVIILTPIIAILLAIIIYILIIAVAVGQAKHSKNNSASNINYNEPVTSSVADSSSSSNDKKSAKDLMGMWSGNSVTMKFAKDGTFYMDDDVVVYVGTYNVDGNYVNLVLGSNTYTGSFTLVNDTLLFSFITPKEQTITLTKILEAEKSAYTISKNIKYLDGAYEIGTGTSVYRSGYFFTKDGMCRKYTNLDKVDKYTEGTYTIEDGMLTMAFGGASESYWLEETEYQLIFYNIRDGKATNYNLTTLIE